MPPLPATRPPAPGPDTSPLAGTLRRVARRDVEHLDLQMRVGVPTGGRWVTRDGVLQPTELERRLADMGRTAGTGMRNIQGTWLLEAYTGSLVSAAALCVLTDRRVPDVGAGNVAMLLGANGRAEAIAFAAPRCAVLSGDPAGDDPTTTALADEGALWAWFRAALVAHLSPLVDALRAVTRRGERALWASVEDVCASHLNWLGHALGCGPEARAYIDLLVGVERPLRRPVRFVEVRHSGGSSTIQRRNGCCLTCLRETSPQLCAGCPRATAAQRAELLRAPAV